MRQNVILGLDEKQYDNDGRRSNIERRVKNSHSFAFNRRLGNSRRNGMDRRRDRQGEYLRSIEEHSPIELLKLFEK
ncbi:MAG: hypothetical protein C0403_16505 [Desulfobacterium sp.]|nr:hypothetical protein [Desulfobacterium sp.]